jgi:hypothetical protein
LTNGILNDSVSGKYLDNSTANPLVANSGITLNSDKSIFTADASATKRRLVDKTYFKSQCGIAFRKMLNLRPGDVTITEPMTPADVRPDIEKHQ